MSEYKGTPAQKKGNIGKRTVRTFGRLAKLKYAQTSKRSIRQFSGQKAFRTRYALR